MGKYFITGATGTVGREVVKSLLEQGHKVVAANRNPDKAREAFGNAVEAVGFDFENPSTYAQAEKTDGVFLLGPPLNLQLFQMLEPFVDYLNENGPDRVVYLSGKGMDALDTLTFHRDMENKLKSTNLDWRIARPDFFSQNFGNYDRQGIEHQKAVFVPAGEGKASFVSSKDIGALVAALLVKDKYKHQAFPLTGPEELSFSDAAFQLSEVIGEPIQYANPDPATFKQVLVQAGMPEFVGDYMNSVYAMIREGNTGGISNGVKELTGRQPESLREVLKRDFG